MTDHDSTNHDSAANSSTDESPTTTDQPIDPVTLEVLRNQLAGIAEEMGQTLIRGAYSPNIKERRDCSTALFDAEGRMIAQAEHIPVHLGAMPAAVEAVLEFDPEPGDVFVLNDPFEGGTHLPDVTMVSTLAVEGEIVGYAVSRAHHADVGGMTPGSMPAGAEEIYQEGLRIPPTRLVAGGEVREEVQSLLLANVRNARERRADLRAQRAANERAAERLRELFDEHGRETVVSGFDAVIDYSRERIENELTALPDGTYEATDYLEGDGVTDDDIEISVAVTIDGASVDVDFSGTAAQLAGNLNAPRAVATSAVYFVVRCLTDPEIPPNHGCYEPVSVHAPNGTLLNPEPPAAVVGGNVETSQRVTDVVFTAFAEAAPDRVPAQGQGTMNNLTIGARDGSFTYYETIAGGFGARADRDGMDGVQVGMTNTLNTPVESLETEYPLRVERYALREGSGGRGRFRGGEGLERTVTVEADATVSLLTERRRHAPAGVAGGEDGATGENLLDGEPVPAKTTVDVDAGTTVTVRTPGGGGHGEPDERAE
ncbi:N-methylhydantoinase (ATP-hydrolyzing) B [Natrialba magadii ATCC 43099]|uniref:5-oxoprolinase n=1 Tax=Natrialba magadii (strain ATCC 43099 / DSM 3394 / CCM 3739 / CIP 104546 / IAM 13178 / JCM 8861 / NBRC 102185 / NCIMB 2190 / MS3) TaxID=547559 RepID=D3SU96_NATMM|nr:hydantoinase B/oxoprolinase family protein [Natrialba magadii]ADD05154.1 N-methylhydantoinase (ATP-hydrolyzing) B [Natrialba magadii ATCC 43099]ELY23192.1 5-oxoprolinase [Natrialba magadii ATCC 43099]